MPLAVLLRRFIGNEAGNMTILFAAALGLGSVLAAFAVDEASLYRERRIAQSTADLAALAAARDPANAFDLAHETFVDAGLIAPGATLDELADPLAPAHLLVEPGRYTADPGLPPAARFASGATPTNAVRVAFTHPGRLYFGQGLTDTPQIGVAAVSAVEPAVAFSLGSRLASLDGGIANAVLNTLLGANVSLSAASYNGLLGARVDVFSFLDALAQELDLGAVSYNDVLATSADHGQIAKALSMALTGVDAAAAKVLAQGLGANGKVTIGKLISLGAFGDRTVNSGLGGTFAGVSAIEMLAVSAGLSDGTHQVSLNVGASVPGLVGISTMLAVGEPMQGAGWYALGPSGTIVRTAQIRLRFVATIGGGLLLLNSQVRLPLYLDVASAEAGVLSATCPASGEKNGTARLWVRPGVARLMLGDVTDAAMGNAGPPPEPVSTTLINVAGLLKVTGSVPVQVVTPDRLTVPFSSAEIDNGRVKSAATSGFTQSLVATLIEKLRLDIDVLGLGLSPKAILDAALRALLKPLTPVLDETVALLLDTLGLKLGEADVTVYAVTCAAPVLVG